MFGIIRTKHSHITCMYSCSFLYTSIYGLIEWIQHDNLIKGLMINRSTNFPEQGIVDPKYLLWYRSQLRYQVGATQGHLISIQVVKWDPDHNEYTRQWKYIFIFCMSLNLPTHKRAQVHNVISSHRQYLYGAAHSCFWSDAHLLQQAFAGESFRKP